MPGSNRIDGIGMGYIVPLWKHDLVDEIMTVSAAMRWRWRAVGREEVFAGGSSGANVVAAPTAT